MATVLPKMVSGMIRPLQHRVEQFLARYFTIPGNRTISHPYTHLKNRLSNIDSNYFDRVHVVIPQVERCQPKYETDRAGRGRPSHHYNRPLAYLSPPPSCQTLPDPQLKQKYK